jgi:hypothetical protein
MPTTKQPVVLPVTRSPKTSIANKNGSDVKYKTDQHGLMTENQYDIDPLFEAFCSLAEPHLISAADIK